MAITLSGNSATIGTTEYSLPNASTTLTPQTDDCILQAIIDFNAMAAGDQYRLRVYEKAGSGASQRVVYEAVLTGAQNESVATPSIIVGDGWDITVKKLSGTDRSIVWSIRKVA